MKRIILLLLLFSNYLTAQQWQPTSIRQRFVNGIGIPTRDTLPGALSDSSQLVLRPQDSVIYFKYKGYWRALVSASSAIPASALQHEVKAGEAITKGQVVYVTSADGTNMIVSKASNATEATSSKTLGLIASTLATNGKGYVITEGLLAGLNTSTATAGDAVWLGTGGNLIYGLANKPTAPAHLVFIGIVTRSNSSNGEIFVKPQNGFELNEIHDVAINSPRNQSILLYDSVAKLWRDTLASVITANKVNYTDTAAMLTPYLRSNVAAATYEPKITAGTTAQYWRGDKSWQTLPVYTLAGLGGQPQLNGIGFVKASGTTISYDNTSYQPLLTNPTTGTGTTNYVTKWTGASTLGNSSIFDNGNVGIGTTSPALKLHVNSGGTGANSFSGFFTDNSANQNGLAFSHLNGTSRIYASYNGTASDQGLAFWTSLSNGAQFERVSINANGNVGIGTTSPAAKLDVNGDIYSRTGFGIYANTYSPYAGNMTIALGGSGNNLLITGGNVGIGTTSPSEKLSVAGRLLVNTNTTDGANALQVSGSAKISSLAGTGERLVAADASGKLVVSTNITSGYYTPTITLINGITSATASPLIYTNINGIVTVTGKITINSNILTEVNELEINLPASNPNVSPNSVGGCGVEVTASAFRTQDVLNFNSAFNYAKIAITFKSHATGSKVYTFSFSYDSNYLP
jgi:hypothetical protein